MNGPLYDRLTAANPVDPAAPLAGWRKHVRAFLAAGYDYSTVMGSDLAFPAGKRPSERTVSLNEGAVITDRATFQSYPWPDPDGCDSSLLDLLADELPKGAKLIVWGPGGILENVIRLVGYERLCLLLADDPALARDIFDAVGSRFIRYYEICAQFDTVGALISNDDWGFKTQPMLSPADLRRYVFPWHKRIVEVIHAAGKPAILHSCGNFDQIMDDVIDGMRYDGKHSFEDAILPVEQAYEQYAGRIAVLGGIDMDFMCRSSPQDVRRRSGEMLARSAGRGGYALGTGNSVPEYVPQENYFAMLSAAAAP
jgi:uroporphyrinogen decarboxylase